METILAVEWWESSCGRSEVKTAGWFECWSPLSLPHLSDLIALDLNEYLRLNDHRSKDSCWDLLMSKKKNEDRLKGIWDEIRRCRTSPRMQ